jgi:alpha-mannosidase
MTVPSILAELRAAHNRLKQPIPLTWHYPPRPSASPLKAVPKKNWPVYQFGPGPWKKNGENWFYAGVTFPTKRHGLAISGTQADIFIAGWQPFTFWLDGEKQFQEEHAWHATGPIADPLFLTIEPGKSHKLVMCIEPMELPGGGISVAVHVIPRRCSELALEIDAAAVQLELAAALAASKTEGNLVTRAAEVFDPEDLRRNRWKAVRKSIKEMETILAPLSPKAKELTVHLTGHSHIDMDWMWTWEDTVYCIRRDFKSVTDIMNDYPGVTFTHSQVPTYEVAREMDPGIFSDVRRRIAKGQWENAAATWVECDLNMADGETLARHMLYSRQWTRKHLGNEAEVVWLPDTFGHPGNMPQLAKLGGYGIYFHMRCNPGEYDNWPARTWTGVDGTRILALSKNYNDDLAPSSILHTIKEHLRHNISNCLHVWGIGDHGGALSRMQLDNLEQYRHKPLIPSFTFSTTGQYRKALNKDKTALPTNTGETRSVFEGCFTTHALMKRYNRECETSLTCAEALSVLAGINRNKALREAWIPALFNQFHDIIDGAAVHDTYIDAHARAKKALAAAKSIQDTAVKKLTVKARSQNGLTLINPLGFDRTEPVLVAGLPGNIIALQDENGKVTAVQHSKNYATFIAESIPAFGMKHYTFLIKGEADTDCIPQPADREKGMLTVETAFATIKIARESGVICSYYDKELERDLVLYGLPRYMTWASSRKDLGLNVFQIIDEAPVAGSAWLINDILKEENLLRGGQAHIVEQGPVYTRVRIKHSVRSSRILEDMIIYHEFNRIDFELEIDWRELGSRTEGVPQLKLAFAAGMNRTTTRSEGPFCIAERPTDGMENPTQKWVTLDGDECSITLLNDSKYGYDASGSRLRTTLLRNACDPDLNSDNRIHYIRLALIPHAKRPANCELMQAGMAFNRPFIAQVNRSPAKAALDGFEITNSTAIVCTALRRAEYSNGILIRLFETSGTEQTAIMNPGIIGTTVREVDFNEQEMKKLRQRKDGKIRLSFRPWEVKTVLVDT